MIDDPNTYSEYTRCFLKETKTSKSSTEPPQLTDEEIDSKLQNLNLTNDYLFGCTFRNHNFFEGLVGLLLGMEVEIVENSLHNEKTERNESMGFKSIRYDIYAKDLKRCIDLEMQNSNNAKEFLSKRAGFYTANLANTSVEAGNDYDTKLDTYVIFLCNFDPFDQSAYHYVAKYECKDNNNVYVPIYDTGDYHHFFNLAADPITIPNKEVAELFKYLRNTTNYQTNINTPELVYNLMTYVHYFKTNAVERSRFAMYEREQAEKRLEWKKEGRQEGEQKTTIKNIKNLMETLNCSFDKAAEALKLTTDELLYYKNLYLSNKF